MPRPEPARTRHRRVLAAVLGTLADQVLGEPPGLLHPLPVFGKTMAKVERACYRDGRAAGALYCAVGTGIGAVSGRAIGSTAVATWLSVGARSLATCALTIQQSLDSGDLDQARRLLPSLVGRDPEGLDEQEISRAVVESVAENTVDAVVAPILWAALLGASGTLGYRAVNTLDAMVGNRSDRYLSYGFASARLDDAASWLPARVTALLVAVARPGSARAVLRAVRTQAPSHPSPNAGVAEAAFAAAMGLRLGGQNHYGGITEVRSELGFGAKPAPSDITRAVKLSRDVTWALLVIAGAVGVAGLAMTPRKEPGR